MTGSDLILRLVELAPRSLRAGAESVVVLYLWVRKHGSPAGFAAAVTEAVNRRQLEVRRDGGFFLRLTPQGFGYLQRASHSDIPIALDMPASHDQATGEERLLGIFNSLNTGAARAVSPAGLKQIWTLCNYRSGDLRKAIDSLIDNGHLVMTVTELPGFVLTSRGRQAAGLTVMEGSDAPDEAATPRGQNSRPPPGA